MIIGITGRKGSGKDTIGEYLINNHGYIRIGFADTLKQVCGMIFGFSDEQLYGSLKEDTDDYWNHSPREILQKVGTDLFRNHAPKVLKYLDEDIWIRSVERKINNLKKEGNKKFVITDVRFQNELDFITKMNGVSLKVVRNVKDNEYSNHESEISIDDFKTDHQIENNSTLNNLYENIEKIIK
jgi:hypothetical protein